MKIIYFKFTYLPQYVYKCFKNFTFDELKNALFYIFES